MGNVVDVKTLFHGAEYRIRDLCRYYNANNLHTNSGNAAFLGNISPYFDGPPSLYLITFGEIVDAYDFGNTWSDPEVKVKVIRFVKRLKISEWIRSEDMENDHDE